MALWINQETSQIAMQILEEVSADKQVEREIYWIHEWKQRGAQLFNIREPRKPLIHVPNQEPVVGSWHKMASVLQKTPMTASELATHLHVTTRTIRIYLTAAAKHLSIHAEGSWGKTRYSIDR